jgi:hypothetical protein
MFPYPEFATDFIQCDLIHLIVLMSLPNLVRIYMALLITVS